MDTDTDMEFGNFQVFNKGSIVPIALYWLPLTYHGPISNSAIYLLCPFVIKRMTCRFQKVISHYRIGNDLQTKYDMLAE